MSEREDLLSGDFYLVPREIIDQFPEINVNNYDHDDACALNSWGCDVVTNAIPDPAQAPTWQSIDTKPNFVECEERGQYLDSGGGLFYFKATHWRPLSPLSSTHQQCVSPASFCALCDLEHRLHEDSQGFHHVVKGARVGCPAPDGRDAIIGNTNWCGHGMMASLCPECLAVSSTQQGGGK